MRLKILSIGLISFLGLSLPGTVGVYYWDRETIWDKVKEDAIPPSLDESLKDVWNILNKKIPEKDKLKDLTLREIKDNSKSDEKSDALKEWCFKKYEGIYRDWFNENKDELLDDVKGSCILKIKDKLEEKNKFTFPEDNDETGLESEFKEKIKSLKNHDDTREEELSPSLKNIRGNSDESKNWKSLRNWCKSVYEKGYQGDLSNRWRLIQLYCIKA